MLAVLLAALAAALIAREGAASSATQFRTPDAGAACRLEGAALICSSLGSAGSVALGSRGASIVARLPWWDASVPVLHAWKHGRLSCRLATGAILCRSGRTAIRVTRDGFAVAA
jgi:hypothetical protein